MTNRRWVREHQSSNPKAPSPMWHWYPGGQYSFAVCGKGPICGMPYVCNYPFDPPNEECDPEAWCSECKRLWESDEKSRQPVMIEPSEQGMKVPEDLGASVDATGLGCAPSATTLDCSEEDGRKIENAPESKPWVTYYTPDPAITEAVRERREAKPYNLPQVPPEIPPEEFFEAEIVGVSDQTPTVEELLNATIQPEPSGPRMDRMEPVDMHAPELDKGTFSDVIFEETNISLMERQIKGLSVRLSGLVGQVQEMSERLNTIQACVEYDSETEPVSDDPSWEELYREEKLTNEELLAKQRALVAKQSSLVAKHDQLQREFISYIDTVREEKAATDEESGYQTASRIEVLEKENAALRDQCSALSDHSEKVQEESERIAKLYTEQEEKHARSVHAVQQDKHNADATYAHAKEENDLLRVELEAKYDLDIDSWKFIRAVSQQKTFLGRRNWIGRQALDLMRRFTEQGRRHEGTYDESSREGQDSDWGLGQ